MQLSREAESAAIVGIAVTSWSCPGVFVRLMPHIDGFSLGALRMAVACVTLLPFAVSGRFRAQTFLAVKNWRCWVLASTMLLYYLVATAAFLYAPVGEVALLIASAPLFTVVLRRLSGHTVLRAEAMAALVAVAGVIVMATPPLLKGATSHSNSWIGVCLSLVAACTAATYAIGNKAMHVRGDAPGAVSQALLTFCLGLLLLPLPLNDTHLHFSNPQLLWIIPLGAFSTALPTVAVAGTAARLSPVVASMINPMTAIAANVVAAVVIHEFPSGWTLLGGLMVIFGVFLSTRPLKSSP